MIIGLLKDTLPERRVALLPTNVKHLVDRKTTILVETGAGAEAFADDSAYSEAGARVVQRNEVLEQANLLVQVAEPDVSLLDQLQPEQIWLSEYKPLWHISLVKKFADLKLTSFSMDTIPRTTRAQAMDVLSSQATVAGYKAVLDAAIHLPSFFPMFMSAAGTIRPANVLVLGAGVAGLQAIAVARRMGAQVAAFDVRSAVKEEVMSLGARFVEVEGAKEDDAAGGYAVEQTEEYKKRQQEAINQHAAKANVVICTAQIPGRKAPLLISKEVVADMQPGSVIIDLASSTGGNCELSEDNKTVVKHGVTIIGQSNYPTQMPKDASKMFGTNVSNFLELLIDDEGNLHLDFNNEIVRGTCITHQGEIYNERVKSVTA
ncbi:NAD(P) transhydrogenase subunit alpha [Gaoshiqia sediminis]|uniref:NAD(P) transhydrogenase subunit alpha part 1 n=1 Tax=Gaoshiqia sediminis TaxID=2986998 RepID=A0AA41Y8M0_9BACT|nr:NAD(P) transhydrogenase subunit alpha [Gaoshiqia sediminis]MCW0481210.1 NAD(P) transhydrogenase subunit alpha [Gaoshiqia sediminis]